MKKIISSLLALFMIMPMACTTAFADNETNQYNFVYTDKIINSNYDIATAALDQYEPNDFDEPCDLAYIQAKSNPIVVANASLSAIDGDLMDGYKVNVYTYEAEKNEKVEEFFVMLGNLSYGDKMEMLITENGYKVAYGTIDGSLGSNIYVSLPVKYNGEYKIYITFAEDFINTEINYTLLVASRYIHGTKKCYASPSTLRNQGRDNFSSAASAVIKETDVPSSAIIDNIYTYGTLTNDKTGIIGICTMKIVNGSNELYSDGPTGYLKNLTSRNIPLAGTWYISYRPEWDNSSTLSNLSISFDYTYDILN